MEVLKVKWKQCTKGRSAWLLNADDYLNDNWELNFGFSILEILGKLNKSSFSWMLKTKACLEWMQEKVGRQEEKIMSLGNTFEEVFFFSKEVREMIGGSGDLNGMHYNGILLMWIIQRRENYQCRGEGNNWRNILEQVKREEIRYINGGSVLVKWWRKQRKIIFYFVIIFKWNIDQVINWAENREETAENLELWNNYLSVGRRVNGLGQC